jgi:hypothetical protein
MCQVVTRAAAKKYGTSTGGTGSGVFKPISGQESAPNAFEGAGSIILSPDRRFLFKTVQRVTCVSWPETSLQNSGFGTG